MRLRSCGGYGTTCAEDGDHRREAHQGKGGCALGSLVGQLAESDPEARALIAAGFDQWSAAISDGLRSLHAEGKLPPDIKPDDLATTLLATLQGGLYSPRRERTTRPLEIAVNTLLALARADRASRLTASEPERTFAHGADGAKVERSLGSGW
jgi:hypothetical protein